MSQGVIYMVWGAKAARTAVTSIATLREVAPEMPVMLIGDHETDPIAHKFENVQVVKLDIDPFRIHSFLAGRVKPLLYALSPWTQTLYVDADTKFRRAPDAGFALLKKWDFVVAETTNRTLASEICGPNEVGYSRKMLGARELLYHNSGMLFWKRNKRVERLFGLWSEEWLRFQGWDEQMALLRALARSDAIFLTVPFTWNTNFPSQAKLLFHDFGQRTAWKFKRRRGRVMTADEARLLAVSLRRAPHQAIRPRARTAADARQERGGAPLPRVRHGRVSAASRRLPRGQKA